MEAGRATGRAGGRQGVRRGGTAAPWLCCYPATAPRAAGRGRDAGEPGLRIVELGDRRETRRVTPGRVEGADARGGLDAAHEPLTHLVLAHLHLDAEQLLDLPADAALLAARVQHARHAIGAVDVPATELVHHVVAVAFEQRHQALHAAEDLLLLRRREEPDEPSVVERVPPGAQRVGGAPDRREQHGGIGIDDRERSLHERKEVVAHPRHAGELRAVRDLVDRDPAAEVERAEREPLLERQDVGPDVVDRVDVGGARFGIGHEQVVLAEHALREVPEQRTDLGTRDPPADRRDRALREPLAQALGERREHLAHRRDVGLDPAGPVEHRGMGAARRAQAGELGDEIFGLGRHRFEVARQGGSEVRRRDLIASRNQSRDAKGRRPVDGIGSGERVGCGRVGGRAVVTHCVGDLWSRAGRP